MTLSNPNLRFQIIRDPAKVLHRCNELPWSAPYQIMVDSGMLDRLDQLCDHNHGDVDIYLSFFGDVPVEEMDAIKAPEHKKLRQRGFTTYEHLLRATDEELLAVLGADAVFRISDIRNRMRSIVPAQLSQASTPAERHWALFALSCGYMATLDNLLTNEPDELLSLAVERFMAGVEQTAQVFRSDLDADFSQMGIAGPELAALLNIPTPRVLAATERTVIAAGYRTWLEKMTAPLFAKLTRQREHCMLHGRFTTFRFTPNGMLWLQGCSEHWPDVEAAELLLENEPRWLQELPRTFSIANIGG